MKSFSAANRCQPVASPCAWCQEKEWFTNTSSAPLGIYISSQQTIKQSDSLSALKTLYKVFTCMTVHCTPEMSLDLFVNSIFSFCSSMQLNSQSHIKLSTHCSFTHIDSNSIQAVLSNDPTPQIGYTYLVSKGGVQICA